MKKIKIFLMGGTKESTEIIKYLKNNFNCCILTTTTTKYGEKLAIENGSDFTIAKPLPKEELIKILTKTNFDLFIDATHPFASHVTKTAISVSKECKIPYIRFERPTSDLSNYDKKHLHIVKSFEEASKLIEKKFKSNNVLHFAGANTMKHFIKSVSPNNFYPRILKVEDSLKKCDELKIPKENIIPMKGTSTIKENLDLIDKINAKVIITKESGDIGGVDAKIQAANERNIDIVMIKRPYIKELTGKTVINNIDNLKKQVQKIINAETGI